MSKIQELKQKFGGATAVEEKAPEKAFEKSELTEKQKQEVVRLSKTPEAYGGAKSVGDVWGEVTSIELATARLLKEEGMLMGDFRSFVSRNSPYTAKQKIHLAYLWTTAVTKSRKASLEDKQIEYSCKEGDNLAMLVDKVGELYEKNMAEAEKALNIGYDLKQRNLDHRKYLEQEVIRCLQEGTVGVSDQTGAELEVKKWASQIAEIDATMAALEGELKAARDSGNMDEVKRLTGDLTEALDFKYQVLEGKAGAESEVLKIRRDIMDRTKGVEVARSAIIGSEANYEAINAFIDAYTDLMIVYEHQKDKLLPLFKDTAATVALGKGADKLKRVLQTTADLAERLIVVQCEAAAQVAEEAFAVLSSDTFDLYKLKASKDRLVQRMENLNERKKQYAEINTAMSDIAVESKAAVKEQQKLGLRRGSGYSFRR